MQNWYTRLQAPCAVNAMPRPLNFRQIEAFRAVMQTGTTTAAAQMLHTTQPSVSRLLAQMQSATGLLLFDMHRGRLKPTAEAQQLFDTVQRHFLGLERIEQSVAILRQSGTGQLRIGCTPALGLSMLPRLLRAFAAAHPEAHVSLQTLSARALQDGLMHGLHDLILTTTPPPADLVASERVHRDQLVAVMHPEHRLARRRHIEIEALEGEVLITLNADDPVAIEFQSLLNRSEVKPASKLETTYSATICALALEGLGVGVVNPHAATVFADRLRVLPLRPSCRVEVYLALAPQAAPSRLAREFTALLKRR